MTGKSEEPTESISDKIENNSRIFTAATVLVRSAVAATGVVGSLVILFMTFLVVADVTLRSFFNIPIKGTSEIGAFLVTAIVFVQTPLAVYEQRLTRLEWFGQSLQRITAIGGRLHGIVIDTAGMIAFLLIAKASLPSLIESWVTAEFFGTQGHFTAPSWPVRLTIVTCSFLAAIAYLLRILKQMASFKRRA